jgi:hypothetical protein
MHKRKGKVVSACHESIRENGGIAPHILKMGNRGRIYSQAVFSSGKQSTLLIQQEAGWEPETMLWRKKYFLVPAVGGLDTKSTTAFLF